MVLRRYPKAGEAVEGEGGSARGLPAAFLRQDNNNNLGLYIGVEYDDAGPDWKLEKVARDPAGIPATARITDNVNVLTVRLPTQYGYTGEGWRIVANAGATTAAAVDAANKRINITTAADQSFNSMAALLNGVLGSGAATVTGSGGATISRLIDTGFSRGRAPGIFMTVDEAAKTVTINYLSTDTMQEIKDAINADTSVRAHAVEVAGTNMGRAPNAPGSSDRPFTEYYGKPI